MSSPSRRFQRSQAKRQQRTTFEVIQQGDCAQTKQPQYTITRDEERQLEKAMEADRQFFQTHPGVTQYVRPAILGECPRVQIADLSRYWVRVTHFADGHRQREFFEPGADAEVFRAPACPERN